ncbi:EamA family transporter [Paenibacillus sp. JSM ZJ436]|uniref:EamA family transporter n=1 Tax=Paenibacillus sp. JSM ZJ436 TaxID=3376190 RepID=UPI00379B4422
MKRWHYAWIVFLGGCCYGVLSTMVKLAYAAGFTVTEVTGSQYAVGALLAWVAVIITGRKRARSRSSLKLLLSGIPFGLTGIFYYQSLQTLNASLAIVILFQFVWIGTLFEWLFYKNKPSRQKLLSILVLLAGSVLAANLLQSGGLAASAAGILWALLASLTFTAFIFLSSAVGRDTPAMLKTALLSTGGMITVFLCFPPVFILDLSTVSGVAPYGFLLGLFGVVLPPLLFSIGMPHVGPGLGTILTASELPVAVSMSALVLGEPVAWLQWLGVLLILGGIVLGNRRRSRPSAAS